MSVPPPPAPLGAEGRPSLLSRIRHRGPLVHNRYELLSCALRGHVLVGTDAAEVTPADAVVVREIDGTRWYRCVRCDAWFPTAPPISPTRPHVPPRDAITLPPRGVILRDHYTLRLIALDRAVHVVLLSALAVVIFVFAGNHAALERDYAQIVQAFGGPSQPHPFLGRLRSYFAITPRHLVEAGVVVSLYAALEAAEMVGLWLAKRWAEYLTFVATAILLPLEVYEITESVSTLKLVTFVINLVIVVYLLLAKRLFGLRGGGAAEAERLRASTGWAALEHSAGPSFEAAETSGASPVGSTR